MVPSGRKVRQKEIIMDFESEEIVFQFGYYTMAADLFKGTTAVGKISFWTEFYNVFDNFNEDLAPEGSDEPSDSFDAALERALPGINLLLSEPIRIEPEYEQFVRSRVEGTLELVTAEDRQNFGNSLPINADEWFARLNS